MSNEKRQAVIVMTNAAIATELLKWNPFGGYTEQEVANKRKVMEGTLKRYRGEVATG